MPQLKLEKQIPTTIKCKNITEDGGMWIEGYAAIFGEVDQDKDRIFPGSFKRSIDNQIAKGKVLLLSRHLAAGGNVSESIAIIKEAFEDTTGFYIRAKIFDTQAAKEVREQILSAPEAYGMSIGWRQTENNRVENEFGGYDYTEINLKEVTITIIPAQEGTLGTLKAKEEIDISKKIEIVEKQNEELHKQYKELKEEMEKRFKDMSGDVSENKSESKSDNNSNNPIVSKGLQDLVSAKNKRILQKLLFNSQGENDES